MKIGVRAHDYGKMSPDALATTLRENGYNCTQLAIPKAIAGINSYGDITPALLEQICRSFGDNQVEITVFGCYMDLGNPDGDIRRAAVETLKKCLAYSKVVNAKVVGTETSYAWLDRDEKQRRWPLVIDSILRAAEEATRLDVKFALEPVYLHPLDSLEAVQKIIETVGDESHLRLIFDASNLLEFPGTTDQEVYWTTWLESMGKYVEAMHIKDFQVAEDGTFVPCALGAGVIDYGPISRWLRTNRPDMPLLREEMNPHLAGPDMMFMKNLIRI